MDPVQIVALVVSLAISLVAIALFVKAIRHIIAVVRLGQPTVNRGNDKGARWATMLKETLAHTRMLQWSAVGVGHWFVFIGFGLLFFTLVNAYGQLFDAHFLLPVIGRFFLFEWVTELFAWAMLVAIVAFIGYRASRPKERERGPKGRFFGSTMWQGYFVEAVILGVGLCILALRGAEYALAQYGAHPDHASAFHFPLTAWLGGLMDGMSEGSLANFIWIVAMVKIVISMVWMIVLAMNTTMGVAWHRFTAWFNIWFKRKADGGTALGALQPMMAGGKPIDFENIDELDEDTVFGIGKAEDFTWKGILDFTTCTECGRCQSQCPAWNTEKPLSPKLFITQLRDHTYAKAPYLLAGSDEEREALPDEVKAEAERELVGATEGWAWEPSGGAVIDPDVLWSCTSCGACVQQCPVDIEHVDHIMDMRRYQVLVESNFPSELNQLFKGLENKGNPWNMSPNARMDWAKDLDFEIKTVGGSGNNTVEDLEEVEWLFWVGCAGAYEDRAKKTTRAVAELLNMAGVDFAVLGDGETCTGDPARRSGNEFVFQQLAMQNAETFKETKVKKVVSTCAHCFNTLKNEYVQFGVELEVVHHTQLLNRLVREGRLTPVATNGTPSRSITYHDPCYLGRHNQVYSPPRELLDIIPNAELTEMPRNSERSFCCGAGGARMWMEEKIGERINLNRTTEAVETGADQIATGCPFCRVMLSDGLTAKQADGSAREEVEVLDIAQMLLASVKRADTPGAAAGSRDGTTDAAAAAGTATAVLDRPATETAADTSANTKAEPEAGDVTQTDETVTAPEQVGANATASEVADPEVESGASSVSGDAPAPDLDAEPAPHPASETEPVDAANTDPDSADVTGADLSEAESTAPDDDAAVQNAREQDQPAPADEETKHDKGDDTLF
ncbi:MAG TPA: heterodisulfide reductase-related iron-sulfur binding cluster [Nocardioidaceae bacterium]|nr:heterodisulfide reductase-related iron-sulfur binding cluster [Nocardioidaceae bacterium]